MRKIKANLSPRMTFPSRRPRLIKNGKPTLSPDEMAFISASPSGTGTKQNPKLHSYDMVRPICITLRLFLFVPVSELENHSLAVNVTTPDSCTLRIYRPGVMETAKSESHGFRNSSASLRRSYGTQKGHKLNYSGWKRSAKLFLCIFLLRLEGGGGGNLILRLVELVTFGPVALRRELKNTSETKKKESSLYQEKKIIELQEEI